MSAWQYMTLATLAVTLLIKLAGILAGIAFAINPAIFNLPPAFQELEPLTWQSCIVGAIGATIVWMGSELVMWAQQLFANSAAEREIGRIRFVATEIERELGSEASDKYLDRKMAGELNAQPPNLLSRLLFR